MLRLCSSLFVLVLIVVGWFIRTTTGELGDPVATHFGNGYYANGWMSRDGYLAFSLAFSTLLPIAVVGIVGWLPRVAPRSLNLPNKDYWLAPERRDATFANVAAYAILLGTLIAIFMAGVHWLILKANAAVPPQLPAQLFWTMLCAFIAAFLVWIGAFWWKFRNVPG